MSIISHLAVLTRGFELLEGGKMLTGEKGSGALDYKGEGEREKMSM